MSTFSLMSGDALSQLALLPDNSVQCVVTSPPYYGLRDYGLPGIDWPAVTYEPMAGLGIEVEQPAWHGNLGLEPTPEMYTAHLVAILREVRRVLREDGVCWINLGDSYAGSRPSPGRNDSTRMYGNEQAPKKTPNDFGRQPQCNICGRFMYHSNTGWVCDHSPKSYKPKDLMGIPWRVALALQADGWWLRSDVIWAKKNPMPESVTDRPTKSHEYVYLLTKSARYFYDAEAIRSRAEWKRWGKQTVKKNYRGIKAIDMETLESRRTQGRNRRSVWHMSTVPFPGAHFAVFPPALPDLCIKAGTSARGCCPLCRTPYVREVERGAMEIRRSARGDSMGEYRRTASSGTMIKSPSATTTGWRPGCTCDTDAESVPCVVLDPFSGAGTTGLVALRNGCDYIGIEPNAEYLEMARARIKNDAPLFNVESEAA